VRPFWYQGSADPVLSQTARPWWHDARSTRRLQGCQNAVPVHSVIDLHARDDEHVIAAPRGAAIVAHAGNLGYYQQKKPMTFCTTDWFSRLLLSTGLILRPYAPFTPDALLQDGQGMDLRPYGLSGRVQQITPRGPSPSKWKAATLW
jgi:hypothetical protein